MWAALLARRARYAQPRREITRCIDVQNADCYLAWRKRWERGFVGIDPWKGYPRIAFDRWLDHKRFLALRWLSKRA